IEEVLIPQEGMFFMAKRRGNPNWGKPEPIGPVTPSITEFEQVVHEYKLSPDQYLRSRVERKYWSGESLYSCTTCSNSVIVGVTGPIGSGLPQFGFPRRFAMKNIPSCGIRTSSIC